MSKVPHRVRCIIGLHEPWLYLGWNLQRQRHVFGCKYCAKRVDTNLSKMEHYGLDVITKSSWDNGSDTLVVDEWSAVTGRLIRRTVNGVDIWDGIDRSGD